MTNKLKEGGYLYVAVKAQKPDGAEEEVSVEEDYGYRYERFFSFFSLAVMHKDKEEYSKSENSSINHFYEKLLLLKDRMNTKSARRLAVGRHKFMEKYLNRFYKEWNAEL